MGNFCAGIGFLYPNKKKLILLALLCVPPAFSCVLVPALVAAALDSSLGAAPAAAGVGAAHLAAWLCAHRARHLAAALAADSALHIRRRAFPEFLRLGAAFPPEAALAAELILPAAAFLRRLLALFFLAAALASAAAFSRELRLPALAALLSFPAALLLARVAGSPAGAGRAPGGLAPLVRALPAAKALGGTRFLEEAFREAASCPASLRFRVVPRGAARVHAVGGCAAGLALAAFVFAAGEFFPALGAGTWFFCLCAIPAVFLACARLGGFPPALREALAAAEKMKPQDAWAADRAALPTRGFAHGLLLRPQRKARPARDAWASSARPAQDAPKPPTRESGGSLHLKGELDLRGLSVFSGDQKLLDGISLKAAQGQKLALVGFSAQSLDCFARVAGLLREYDEGELRLDGKDMRTLDPALLRERIDFIPREPFLFEGTLGENIRCGRPSASEEEILRAAARLGRGDWLHEIPDGLSAATPGPGKPAPSWAPLAALARALLKKPALCIIDEPLPLRDPFAEIRMQEAICSIMGECTCLVVARRLSTLRQAQRIIVFDGNKIAQEGSHGELLAENGLYAKIYNAFFRHQSPAYFHEILEGDH